MGKSTARPRLPNFGNTRVQDTPVIRDGRMWCRRCDADGVRTPNHPQHPRSPHCVDCYEAVRRNAQRKARVAKQQRDRAAREADGLTPKGVARTSDGSRLLTADAVTELTAVLTAARDQLEDTAGVLSGLSGDPNIAPSTRRMMAKAAGPADEHQRRLTAWVRALQPPRRGPSPAVGN